MTSQSSQPRRQRRALYDAKAQERRRRMTVPLSRELRTKYKRRNLPVRKGDTVRIISGSYVGQEQRVAKIGRRIYAVTLDNVTGKTAEAKLKPLPIRPSHLVLTKLNLSDPWRRRVLRVTPEEFEAETAQVEEVPSAPEPSASETPTPSPEVEPEPAAETPPSPPTGEALPPAAETDESPAAATEAPAPKAKRPRRTKPKASEE